MADLSRAINIEDLRELARRRLPRAIFDFFDGGAEDEATLRDNRAAFERVRLLPRVLVRVSQVDTRVSLFGSEARLPLAIAPTGGISAGRWGAELALARAAKAAGVPFTMATPSAFTIERVAEEVGGRLWFQLYAVRDLAFREKLVERAKNCGYEAILVTVDLPVSGKRERDPRNGFHTPYSPNWRNSRDVIFKPAWALDMLRHGLPGMANLEGYRFSTPAGTDIVTAVGREMDADLDWEYIKRLRGLWPGKLLLKGVERPDDAERAAAGPGRASARRAAAAEQRAQALLQPAQEFVQVRRALFGPALPGILVLAGIVPGHGFVQRAREVRPRNSRRRAGILRSRTRADKVKPPSRSRRLPRGRAIPAAGAKFRRPGVNSRPASPPPCAPA